jgi:phage-related protein
VPLKSLYWIASSLRDLKAMPVPLQKAFGTALRGVQLGGTPQTAKPLKGFGGAGVLELVEGHDRGTYRTVYTVTFAG